VPGTKKLIDSFKDPKKLFRIVRSPRVIVGLLGLTFAFQVFRFGRRLGMRGGMRLWIAIGILVIAIAVIIILRIREKKKAKQIEDSLLLEADSQVLTSSGAQRAADERAREEMAEAIQRLKSSKVASGRSGKVALHVLPWYLVLGRGESGKSKAILNSGLTFPGSKPADLREKEGVGPGRICKWWFTSQAVVLEANGRFVDEEDDVEAGQDWKGILEVLRKARGDVPLQGIVISLSAEDLIRHDSARLDAQARVLRQRLDEAITTLQSFAPVYLMITKVDLVHGFEEYFADLEGNARDQAFGATLTQEQIRTGDPLRAFSREFEILFRSLCQRRIPRMVSEVRLDKRGHIYLFPLELLALRPKLTTFVKTLFEPNPYGERPMFRGFYFSSGSLEGRPVEMVVNEVSRVIGIPPGLEDSGDLTRVIDPASDSADQAGPDSSARRTEESEPRFLREVFTRILPRSSVIAHPTEQASQKRRARRLGLQIAGYASIAVLGVLLLISFFNNRGLLSRTDEMAREAASVQRASTAEEVETQLRLLESFRQTLADLDEYDRSRPLTMGFGLYRGAAVNERARRVYLRKLFDALLRPSQEALGNWLERSYLYSPTPAEFEEYFDNYRAYRMLSDRDPGRADPVFLADQLADFWLTSTTGPTANEEGLRNAINRHVTYAWNHVPDVRYQLVESRMPGPSRTIIGEADAQIRQHWDYRGFYGAMISAVNDETPVYSLDRVPGAVGLLTAGAALATDETSIPGVPGSFTREGWELISQRIAQSESLLRDDWILGEALQGVEFEDMRTSLVEDYRRDYVDHWIRFLSAVDLVPARGIAGAEEQFRKLLGQGSPFLVLLQRTAANLRFATAVDETPEESEEEEEGVTTDSPLADIQTRFVALHKLWETAGEGEEAAIRSLDEYLDLLGEVRKLLRALQEVPGPSSMGYAAKIFGSLATDPSALAEDAIFRTIRFAEDRTDLLEGDQDCAKAVRSLLRRPAEGAWGSILRECERHLNDLWKQDVYDRYRDTILGKYPFSGGGADADLGEFGSFFTPGGIFWTFYDNNLDLFLDQDETPIVRYRKGFSLTSEGRAAILKARAIRGALFEESGGGIALSFQVTPRQTKTVEGNPPFVHRSVLVVGDREITYNMGPPRARPVAWPGEPGREGASVGIMVDVGSPPEKVTADGPWALFRLLEEARVERASSTEYTISWVLGSPTERYRVRVPYDLTASSGTNPFDPGFFRFSLPEQIASPSEAPALP
jgi:type VI secretion system protein ImpL